MKVYQILKIALSVLTTFRTLGVEVQLIVNFKENSSLIKVSNKNTIAIKVFKTKLVTKFL